MVRQGEVLRLPDAEALADLATFAARARRADPDGVVRLAAHGDVLVVSVSPVHGSGGPTVIGLRVVRLAVTAELDVVVALAAFAGALEDALAGVGGEDAGGGLVLPSEAGPGAAWTGTGPPQSGWTPVCRVSPEAVGERARAGIAEIVAGSPPGSGAAAVAALRARVWGRPLVDDLPELSGLPAGAAFVAEALGFVADDEPAVVYSSGPWWRVTTTRGHVLARRPALG
jgi:hypothetical protein